MSPLAAGRRIAAGGRWFLRHWQPFVIAATAFLVLATLVVGLSALATGGATNRVVNGQQESNEVSECRGAYAAAEAAAATKYRHAQTVLIEAIGDLGDTTIPEALQLLAETDAEQVRYTALRLRANELCDPPGDADDHPPILPPPIDPPEVEDFTD